MKKIFILALLSAIVCSGCRTAEFYQDRAVQKARNFLLKKCPELSYEESSYIRYNKPVILHSDIIGGTDSLTASSVTSDLKQIQITWNVPGKEEFYAVWGVCSSTMRDFSPERVFIRKFRAADTNRINAVKRAKAYIIGNLFGTLSVEDYNDIRFREPQISFSKFELEKSISPADGEYQFAMIWNLKSKPGVKLAVIGNGRKNLADFKAVSISELPESDISSKLLEPYKFISQKELDANEKAAAEAKKAEELKKAEKLEIPAEAKVLAEDTIPDSAVAADKKEPEKKKIFDENIVDELPEAPELDDIEDLEEPEL